MKHITVLALALVLFSGVFVYAQESQKCDPGGEKVLFQKGDFVKDGKRVRISRYLNIDPNCTMQDRRTDANIRRLFNTLEVNNYGFEKPDEAIEPRCHAIMGLYGSLLDQSQQVTRVACPSDRKVWTLQDNDPEYNSKISEMIHIR